MNAQSKINYSTQPPHPVPAGVIQPLPCGCRSARYLLQEGGWAYVTYARPDCRFDGRRIGSSRGATLWVTHQASDNEVREALNHHGIGTPSEVQA